MAADFLPDATQETVRQIGQADLLIGIPSYNDAATIQPLVRSIVVGLATCFPKSRSVVLLSDGGSQDGTIRLFEQAGHDASLTLVVQHPVPAVQPMGVPDRGVPGYENALGAILQASQQLGVRACALIDGSLWSVTGEWVGRLLSPIADRSFDLVTSVYRRHKYEGTLTNSLLYPMTRALYGKRISSPSGGSYGFSSKLVSTYLIKDLRGGLSAQLALDNWLTTVAVAEGHEVCQASLGTKLQQAKSPTVELSVILSQAVGSVFSLMEEYQSAWEGRSGSSPVPTFGPPEEVATEWAPVNRGRMVEAFKQGLRDLLPLWEVILAQDTMAQILPLGLLDDEDFRFPMDIWVQAVYDFALAYHHRVIHREHLLRSLTPLYLGRTASFVAETLEGGPEEVQHCIERLCEEYETLKPYLVERWR